MNEPVERIAAASPEGETEEARASRARSEGRYDRVAAEPVVQTPLEIVTNAFVIWVFAGQILQAIGSRLITPDLLESHVVVGSRHDPADNVEFDQPYADQDELMIMASNGMYVALGTFLIATDNALEALGPRDPKDLSELGAARSIVYMLRCAFAHGPLSPVWECREPYRQVFEVASARVRLDARELHGKPFRFADVGGNAGLVALYRFCLTALLPKPEEQI